MKTDLAQALLAGRIGAQDRLIGVLLAVAMSRKVMTPKELSSLIESQAAEARAQGSAEEAAYLMSRADSLRAMR